MKILYKHLQSYIKSNPNQNDISERLFQLGHENEYKDGIYDIEFTPNRGDCLSLKGILRDLSAFYEIESIKDDYHDELKNLDINFSNKAKVECPSISFLKIEIEDVPFEYKGVLNNYFSDLDVKKNNFFTDISNYISYETGQPTHCYDSSTLNNYLKLEFHEGKYTFNTLLDTEVVLQGKNLVFLSKDDEVLNLAGIVGGSATACKKNTTSVVIECAHFNPEDISGKSVKYNISSDAAHKFERSTDPHCHEYVLRRFIKIVEEHTDIKNVQLFQSFNDLQKQKTFRDRGKKPF